MIKSKKQFLCFVLPLILIAFMCNSAYSVKAATTSGFVGEAAISANGYPEIVVSGTNNYNYAKEVLSKVNAQRTSNGLSGYTIDKELTENAMQRAAELSVCFDHVRPNGEMCFSINNKVYGENIAAYQATPTSVMNTWMNSSGHKANILNSSWKSIGIGCFYKDGLYYWVQLFSIRNAENSNVENGTKNVNAKIEVPISDMKVYANNNASIELEVGKEATLKTTSTYNNSQFNIRNTDVQYNVSNGQIATISNGKIKALKEGTVTITAKIGDNQATCSVKVVPRIISVYYKTHVQTEGWQSYVRNGATSGTSGKSLRLEGIQIYLDNLPVAGGVEYCTHVQNIGWQNYVSNNQMSGTTGQSLRLEAIKIRLTGDFSKQYDIYYRVHCQNFGWMGWAKNGEAAGTAGYSYRLEAIEIKLVPKGGTAPGSVKNKFKQNIQYQTHIQNIGWQGYVNEGEISGTTGKGLRLEGIRITTNNSDLKGNIEYCTHVQNIGWQNFVTTNQMSGTQGKSLRLEAIKIKLTGDLANKYDIYYRVHCQNFGWMGWAKNGEASGTAGYSYRLEAIEIRLVDKGDSAPGSSKNKFKQNIQYQTHIQNIGWQGYVNEGEISGTTGKGLRLEGIRITTNNSDISGSIEYSTHVQTEGWQNFVSTNQMSGTQGKSLRLEAIKIRLTGELANRYDVYYRVHCQNFGWMGWAKNGEASGTSGYSYRLEAIQIMLVEKGDNAPGSTANAFKEYVKPTKS